MKEKNETEVSKRILHVARELFIANGYNGTSIRDIATASDANVAHIKYYFSSKAKLFEIIFDEAFEVVYGEISTTLTSDMPFIELVERWINVYYSLLPKYPQIPIFILNEINHNSDILAAKVKSKNPVQVFNKLSKRMEEEIANGSIRNIPPLDFGLNILSLCIFPFVFNGFVTRITDCSMDEYNLLMQEHKNHVIAFVKNALAP